MGVKHRLSIYVNISSNGTKQSVLQFLFRHTRTGLLVKTAFRLSAFSLHHSITIIVAYFQATPKLTAGLTLGKGLVKRLLRWVTLLVMARAVMLYSKR